MTTTFTSYSMVTRDLTRSITAVKKQPPVQREVDYYLSKIGSVKTVDEFVSDKRLMTFALTAFGLKDMAYAKAFVRKILKEGQDDSTAFVHKLEDKRYIEFAKAFDFKRYGTATTAFTAVQQGVADKYVRQTLESQAGGNNAGVQLALYFERNAGNLTSATEILTDKAMTQVAKTALRLPDVFSLMDIDKQIAVMEKRIKVTDFKDPVKLEQFIKRFATLWDVDNASASQNPALSLYTRTQKVGISDAVMASLSRLGTRG